MRNFIVVVLISAALVASGACGGASNSSSTPMPSTPASGTPAAKTPAAGTTAVATTSSSTSAATSAATTSAATTSAATTPAATAPPSGAKIEVTGIVGGVNLNGNVIEIKRLSGASVTEIAVKPTTVIRTATGGKIAFAEIRTSDRIIASGALNDRRDQLDATEITVQDVVPGAQPGG